MSQNTENNVFSRKIDAATISARGTDRQIEATAAERAAVADLLGLQALDSLSATLSLRRLASGLIEVKGKLMANAVQSCVVTLEPVPEQVGDSFRVTYGASMAAPEMSEIDIDYEEADPPEPIVDGVIDLGALVTEHLSLALDPYPRKPGADVAEEYKPETTEPAPSAKVETHNPFSGLDKLIK